VSERGILNAQTLLRLAEAVAPARVSTDPGDLLIYGQDWTRGHEPRPAAIVFPETVFQVVRLVQFAGARRLPLVPSGGRTGLSGGAVAAAGEIVVSLERMNRILDFQSIDRMVTVQAGVVTAEVQTYAADRGLMFPIDLAARGSCQIGGNIATNAGGIKVIRYGMTRDWVAGLKVVTGRGDVLELNRGLIKNASGYDLRHLFVGSEGTLGLIVEATLRLCDPLGPRQVLLLAIPGLAAIHDLLLRFREALALTAFEFFSESGLRAVNEHFGLARPLITHAPYYLLVEFEQADGGPLETAMQVYREGADRGWILDGVASRSEEEARTIWRFREDITEATAPRTPYKNDVSVLVSRLPEFLGAIERVIAKHYPDFEVVWFGHIGDGNMHLNILKPADLAPAEFESRCHRVNELVCEVVQRFGGSVAAEHGVGLLKQPYLHYTRSAEEIAAMKDIKAVFDPHGIMNPGKLIA
jgi:FAD/FMN-containing dehydrogenase